MITLIGTRAFLYLSASVLRINVAFRFGVCFLKGNAKSDISQAIRNRSVSCAGSALGERYPRMSPALL